MKDSRDGRWARRKENQDTVVLRQRLGVFSERGCKVYGIQGWADSTATTACLGLMRESAGTLGPTVSRESESTGGTSRGAGVRGGNGGAGMF